MGFDSGTTGPVFSLAKYMKANITWVPVFRGEQGMDVRFKSILAVRNMPGGQEVQEAGDRRGL